MKKCFGTLLLISGISLAPCAQQMSQIPPDDCSATLELRTVPGNRDMNRITLEWNSNLDGESHFYAVERSVDGRTFEVLGVLRSRSSQRTYFFTDERPFEKTNYYRIKVSCPDGRIIFSKIISCGVSAKQFCRFYPNPVEKFLIIRSESAAELTITDASSKVRINRQIVTGLQLVDVSSLEKGFYIITLVHKGSHRIISDKLIKS